MKSDRFGTIRKKNNTSNLQKLDSINQDKNGVYIGCVQVEMGTLRTVSRVKRFQKYDRNY